MKSLILFFSGATVALVCVWLALCGSARPSISRKNTFSSFDPPRGPAAAVRFEAGTLKLAEADLEQVLNLYQEVSARTVIRGDNLPPVKTSLHNQTPLTRVETLQLLDTALAENGITMVLIGDASVKAVQTARAAAEVPPTFDASPDDLPDSSSYMTCSVRLKHAGARDVSDVLAQSSRMQKSIIALPSEHLLILRDYSANIRQMLRLLEKMDRPPLPWAGILNPAPNPAMNPATIKTGKQRGTNRP